eukprot:c6675_g1_i1.p1 GENE.c6675_g1_i1~~c6675_g1_i1.p1  ORF type:complete len:268 (-),score=50.10 c6675_g1_i1:118-921(-)
MVHPSHIVLTGKNRVRLSGFGLADILGLYDCTSAASLRHAQFEDILCLGKVILQLACQSPTAALNIPKALETMSQRYSPHLRDYVSQLLSNSGISFPSAREASASSLLTPRLSAFAEAALAYSDDLETLLSRELESSRISRLLMRLGFINERPSFEMDPNWSETGDRYLLKLFRDYVFHQEDEDGKPVIDYAHVISCLNKLDVGSSEKLLLVSRDETSVIITTYAELKRCMQSCMNELAAAQRSVEEAQQQHQQQQQHAHGDAVSWQ